MVHAFILAKVQAGKDEEVLKEVNKLTGVQHTTPTYGQYDLHVEVSFKDKEQLDEFILEKIRKVVGVTDALTLIAFSRYEKSE